MGKLVFAAADVKRVVEHSIASKQGQIADWSAAGKKNGFEPAMKAPDRPTVILVHDQGVYLMSNGEPRDVQEGSNLNSAFVAYAQGCDPIKDADWHQFASELVGGDDFGEPLPWAVQIKKMLDDGAAQIVVNFGRSASLSAVYPKGMRPKGDIVPWTPDALVKHLQKKMAKTAVAFDPRTGKLALFSCAPLPPHLDKIRARGLQVLNGAPKLDLYKAVTAHLETERTAAAPH